MNFKTDIFNRIYDRIDFDNPNGCWLYSGTDNGKGYKLIYADGRMHSVHRLMYMWRFGEIPQGKEIHHKCLNRDCVYPAHLEAVSHRENVARTQAYEALRLVRLKILVAAEQGLRESGTTCLTSRRLGELWDCRSDNVHTVLSTISMIYGDDFEWEITLSGRGRRPTLFTVSMASGLVDDLQTSVDDHCQSLEKLILNLASPALVVV